MLCGPMRLLQSMVRNYYCQVSEGSMIGDDPMEFAGMVNLEVSPGALGMSVKIDDLPHFKFGQD